MGHSNLKGALVLNNLKVVALVLNNLKVVALVDSSLKVASVLKVASMLSSKLDSILHSKVRCQDLVVHNNLSKQDSDSLKDLVLFLSNSLDSVPHLHLVLGASPSNSRGVVDLVLRRHRRPPVNSSGLHRLLHRLVSPPLKLELVHPQDGALV